MALPIHGHVIMMSVTRKGVFDQCGDFRNQEDDFKGTIVIKNHISGIETHYLVETYLTYEGKIRYVRSREPNKEEAARIVRNKLFHQRDKWGQRVNDNCTRHCMLFMDIYSLWNSVKALGYRFRDMLHKMYGDNRILKNDISDLFPKCICCDVPMRTPTMSMCKIPDIVLDLLCPKCLDNISYKNFFLSTIHREESTSSFNKLYPINCFEKTNS